MIKYFFCKAFCGIILIANAVNAVQSGEMDKTDSSNFNTIGTLIPNANSKIGSQVSGRLDQILVEVGERVQKGQPLAILDTVLLEIDYNHKIALLDSSRIEFDDSEKNFQRMTKLWQKPEGESPSISLKRYEEAKSRQDQAAVQVRQNQEAVNRAKFSLDEATIKAPFDGIITKKFIDPGEAITTAPSTDIIEIQSVQPLFLEFALPQSFLSWINTGTPITFEVEGSSSPKNEGIIALIYPCVDESTRSVKCRVVIENADQKLRPGSLAKVEIKTP